MNSNSQQQSSKKHSQAIATGASAMGLQLTEAQLGQLTAYLTLLNKWNKAYNLTAVRDIQQMIPRHLLDSLSVVPHIVGNHILDVGTGPGLPGIPLAICFPDKQLTLLDSNGKKTRFLVQAKTALQLDNIQVVQKRVEQFQVDKPFDIIISRAFSALKDMVKWTQHLLAPEGYLFAMKGVHPVEEIQQAEALSAKLVKSIPLNVANCEGERHLVILQNNNANIAS
ncbi:16S rRNA (guanine(527)-N(7))-methyltransferase RsmG [Spartinivicinus ruber]|uniref:16S rRNA (guanine(527)-N(7))-methyltransferase RsmG n=1 Tax=Spartinivicinus ruber TaxID=2683272 RepID=UPI0013D0844C|nr:16S rRNA (guanine(527)-N(7))-methyltransferase RsmG [Spartinivicinus ruber]